MRKALLIITLIFGTVSIFAQPVIKFDEMTIDFGNIKEEGGKVSKNFEFTNTGDKDLLIASVKPGCGCTAADYTKTPILPGGRGFISATYDPYNRPGGFHKNIKVTTNEPKFDNIEETPYLIFIKGNVEKRPPTKYETAGYKSGSGEIRIKENSLKLDMLNTEVKSLTVLVKNFSETKSSTFLPINLPAFITLDKNSTNKTFAPDEEAEITFVFDGVKRNEFGSYRDVITIQTEDVIEPKLTVFVDVNITEDFSKLTPKQLQDAPKASLDLIELNFDKVEKNTNPNLQVKLFNNGKNTMIIRQLKSSTTVFSIISDKTEILKGDSATLTITLNSRNRRGVQNGTIDIVTNDPANPKLILVCSGDVLQ